MTVETQKQNEVCAVATAKAFSFRTVLVARGIHFNQVGSFAGYDWLATVYGREDIEIILKDTGDLASSREDARVRYKWAHRVYLSSFLRCRMVNGLCGTS